MQYLDKFLCSTEFNRWGKFWFIPAYFCFLNQGKRLMTENETWEQRWQRLSSEIGNTYEADVILYCGDIEDSTADNLTRITKQADRKPNVFLMLATRGGSPDAAYRIARSLQGQYEKFIIYIYGMCKSAGTLVSIGADEIILSDFGEFGPLDVQLGKKDELFESISGLNITQALNSLNTRALDFFKTILLDLRQASKGQISTKLASDISSSLTIGVYGTIYSQIDPVQLGSIERAINIASDYGNRLKSANVKTGQ
jgi:ClpP class serine protease